MQVAALLAAVMLASMPYTPPRLTGSAPAIYMRSDDCAAAQRDAGVIGAALGFAEARMACLHRPAATLFTPVWPRHEPVPGLIAWGEDGSGTAPISETVQIPADIPFVAATGSIVAYVKLDTLLLSVPSENTVQMAFALEDAGISRSDVVSTNENTANLLVRVRPLSAAQLRKIIATVRAHQRSRPVYWAVGFVNDCNAVFASLAARALERARDRARLMAEAANSRLGRVLAVVDSGAATPDALCGIPKNAQLQQYAAAALTTHQTPGGALVFTPQLYATIRRSVSAAWRLELPANPPGHAWQTLPEFEGKWWDHERPPFISDGLRTVGAAVLPHTIQPTSVRVALPDWAIDMLNTSPYARSMVDFSFGIPPLRPAIQLRAASTSQLKSRLDALLAYLRRMTPPKGASLDLSFRYSRDDCSAAIGEALYEAARDAIAKAPGRFRYLEDRGSQALGPVSCTYEPGFDDQWLNSPVMQSGGTVSGVDIGY